MLYSYKKSFSGFSAKLNASQAIALSSNYWKKWIHKNVLIDFLSAQKSVFFFKKENCIFNYLEIQLKQNFCFWAYYTTIGKQRWKTWYLCLRVEQWNSIQQEVGISWDFPFPPILIIGVHYFRFVFLAMAIMMLLLAYLIQVNSYNSLPNHLLSLWCDC